LPPAFYRSLKAWNDAHPDRALWLLHGVWTELPPGDDYDAVNWKAAFRAEMRRVVDLVHGHGLIAARPGHAFGRHDSARSVHVRGGAAAASALWLPAQPAAQGIRQRPRIARRDAGARDLREPGGLFRFVSRLPLLSGLHRSRFGVWRCISRGPVSLLRLSTRS